MYMCIVIIFFVLIQVHNLPKELLSKRNVVHVDIVNDPVSAQVQYAYVTYIITTSVTLDNII